MNEEGRVELVARALCRAHDARLGNAPDTGALLAFQAGSCAVAYWDDLARAAIAALQAVTTTPSEAMGDGTAQRLLRRTTEAHTRHFNPGLFEHEKPEFEDADDLFDALLYDARMAAGWLEALSAPTAPVQDSDLTLRRGPNGIVEHPAVRDRRVAARQPVQDADAEYIRGLKGAVPFNGGLVNSDLERLERIAVRLSVDHTGVLVEALRPLSEAAPQGEWIIGEGTEVRAFNGGSTRWFGSFGDREATEFAVAAVNLVRTALAARGDQSPDASGEK